MLLGPFFWSPPKKRQTERAHCNVGLQHWQTVPEDCKLIEQSVCRCQKYRYLHRWLLHSALRLYCPVGETYIKTERSGWFLLIKFFLLHWFNSQWIFEWSVWRLECFTGINVDFFKWSGHKKVNHWKVYDRSCGTPEPPQMRSYLLPWIIFILNVREQEGGEGFWQDFTLFSLK